MVNHVGECRLQNTRSNTRENRSNSRSIPAQISPTPMGKPVLCVPIPTGNNLQFTWVSPLPVPMQLSTTTVSNLQPWSLSTIMLLWHSFLIIIISTVHHVNVPQNTVKLPLPIVHCTIQQYCRTVHSQCKIKSCKHTIQCLSQPSEHQVFVH